MQINNYNKNHISFFAWPCIAATCDHQDTWGSQGCPPLSGQSVDNKQILIQYRMIFFVSVACVSCAPSCCRYLSPRPSIYQRSPGQQNQILYSFTRCRNKGSIALQCTAWLRLLPGPHLENRFQLLLAGQESISGLTWWLVIITWKISLSRINSVARSLCTLSSMFS